MNESVMNVLNVFQFLLFFVQSPNVLFVGTNAYMYNRMKRLQ